MNTLCSGRGFSFALVCLGVAAIGGWGDRAQAQIIAPTVVIDGVSVQTSSGFSFSYTQPRVVPGYVYGGPIYPAPGYGYVPPGYGQPYRSRLGNPAIVSPAAGLTIVNPTIVTTPVYPYYAYPPIYNSVQIINRPSPEIVVDPQYGVRFKNPPGY